MPESPSPNTYSKALATVHWIMAALIIFLIIAIEAREFIPRDNPLRGQVKALHFSLGLAALGFLVIRLGLRLASPTPAIVPKPASWQIGLSHATHLALYLLMIALPLLGWATLSALGKDISFFGIAVPPIIAEGKEFGKNLEEVHKTLGNVMMYLIGLHAAAALFHHAIVKDNTLVRMLPGKSA